MFDPMGAAPGLGAGATVSWRDRVAARWPRLDARSIGDASTGAIVSLVYLLSQADEGIRGDAHIYMGRALADLDPAGVARDLMFVDDGQSGFSVFRFFARFGVEHLGLAATTRLFDLSAALLWAGAILFVVSVLRPGRAGAIVAAAALLLPRWYSPWSGMGAGEALAIPRPFAEAAVLVALGMLARGRPLAAALLLCAAATLHPIMAAPGFGILFIALVRSDRRWLVAGVAGTAAVLVGGALKAPILSRLYVEIDPSWLSILRERNPHLFVTAWTADAMAIVVLQTVTILIASALVRAPFRALLRSVVAVALLGCLASAVLCDGLHLLLFAQAQLWRSLWLSAAFAPLSAGICLWRLPRGGARHRMALAALVAAWACFLLQPLGAIFALCAAGLFVSKRPILSRASHVAIWCVAGAAVLFASVVGLRFLLTYRQSLATDALTPLSIYWRTAIPSFAVIAFIVFGATRPGGNRARIYAMLVVLALLILLVDRHDDRPALKADLDDGRVKADLVALLAPRPGEILWLGGDELWYWTRRPNWNSALQGAGIVFSRDLALLWHDRAQALVAHGLASESYLSPWKQGVAHPPVVYDRRAIEDLCRRADAPAWVVLPLVGNGAIDPDVRIWTSAFEDRRFVNGRETSDVVKKRLVIPCN